jgi:catechol 2,3-dioxygenase-like lactoylglutathione lyase family enzyme
MILDHIGITVRSFARSRAFYAAALAPLGLREVMGFESFAGFGRDRPEFWIGEGRASETQPRLHVAFAATTRAQVDAFHRAAIATGGTDNGAPGLRPHYHPNYYGAFVLDPDGTNIEAVCHTPE